MSDLDNAGSETNDSLPGANDQTHGDSSQSSSSNNNSQKSYSRGSDGQSSLADLPEWAKKEIKDLRQENVDRRIREKEIKQSAEDARRVAEDAKNALNEIKEFKDSFSKDLKDTREKILAAERRAINLQLEAEASKAGVVDLDIFKKMVDTSSLQVSEDGRVIGVDTVIKSIKDKHPILFDNRQIKNTGNYGHTPKPAVETKKDLTGLEKKDYQKEKAAHMKKIRDSF